jgi:hypothetical protein
MFVVVSKTDKNNFFSEYRTPTFQTKNLTGTDQNKNHRIRIQEVPGYRYVAGNDPATDLSPVQITDLPIELPVVWRIHQILIQNQFARKP